MEVSAIIPTYNRRAHVIRAIDSVLAQTIPVEEIIVTDDGSTDDTVEALTRRYGSSVNVVRQENMGAAAARNRGMREARCEWIAFLDSDDIWLPTKIERQLEALTPLTGESGVCFTDVVFDANPDMKQSAFQEAGFERAPAPGTLEEPTEHMLAERRAIWTSSLLIRTSLIRDVGGFDEALVLAEDTDLLFRLSFKTRFRFVGEVLVRMDRDPSRATGLVELFSTRDDRKYDSFERMYTKWLAMPEVAGTRHRNRIRDMLRVVYYSSVEAKMHELRLRPAFRRIRELRALGETYPSFILTLLGRKIKKLRSRPKAFEEGRVGLRL